MPRLTKAQLHQAINREVTAFARSRTRTSTVTGKARSRKRSSRSKSRSRSRSVRKTSLGSLLKWVFQSRLLSFVLTAALGISLATFVVSTPSLQRWLEKKVVLKVWQDHQESLAFKGQLVPTYPDKHYLESVLTKHQISHRVEEYKVYVFMITTALTTVLSYSHVRAFILNSYNQGQKKVRSRRGSRSLKRSNNEWGR